VLFFVSVGMLFDPGILVRDLGPVLVTVLIIVVGKSVAAFLIVRLFGHPASTAITISASLAQIGEFSFILAGLGVGLALMPERARDLVLAGALLSILLNPLLFAALDWYLARKEVAPEGPTSKVSAGGELGREPIPATALTDHVVLVGHGRVGSVVSSALRAENVPLLLIEENEDVAVQQRQSGLETIAGNAADGDILLAANLPAARCLLVAIPDAFEGGQVVAQARSANPNLLIIARSHSEEETEHLMMHGASKVIMGEHEIARAMLGDVSSRPRPGDSQTRLSG
jgi:K+:H+ antiporter